jgi:hypothetical protein
MVTSHTIFSWCNNGNQSINFIVGQAVSGARQLICFVCQNYKSWCHRWLHPNQWSRTVSCICLSGSVKSVRTMKIRWWCNRRYTWIPQKPRYSTREKYPKKYLAFILYNEVCSEGDPQTVTERMCHADGDMWKRAVDDDKSLKTRLWFLKTCLMIKKWFKINGFLKLLKMQMENINKYKACLVVKEFT